MSYICNDNERYGDWIDYNLDGNNQCYDREEKLGAYLQVISKDKQTIIGNIPQRVSFDTIIISENINVNLVNGDILVNNSGVYSITLAMQVGRQKFGDAVYNFRGWLNKNGKSVEGSNTLINLPPWTRETVMVQRLVELKEGDSVSVMMASNAPGETVALESIFPNNEPMIPSVSISMYKIK